MVSFGGTKNGCWCAEALVLFDPGRARVLPYIRKRAAQLFSKTRFIAAQFEAYLEDGLWLKLAGHANAMASRPADAVRENTRCRLAWEVRANEVFVILPAPSAEEWRARGVGFHLWPAPADLMGKLAEGEVLVRLVTSFATPETEVAEFIRMLGTGN